MTEFAHYTVAADWDRPLPQPLRSEYFSNICFFSGRRPSDVGWDYRELPRLPEIDQYRLSRLPKAMPHKFLTEFSGSIYCDATVQVREEAAERWAESSDQGAICLIQLTSRKNLLSEFELVARKRYDTVYALEEQLDAYRRAVGISLKSSMFWGGLIVRRHFDQQVIDFGERWWWNILRYSRRDQLSLPISLQAVDSSKRDIIKGSENGSPWHTRLMGVEKSRKYRVGFRSRNKLVGAKSEEEKLVAEIMSLRRFAEQLLKFSFLVRIFNALESRRRGRAETTTSHF